MAKRTLLELVQKVLNSINGDEVNSINDTVEALQVANIIEDVYFNIVTNTDIPEHADILELTALSDTDFPNYLKLPTGVSKVKVAKYDTSTDTRVRYSDISYVSPQEFLARTVMRDSTASNVQVVTHASSVKLLILNDKHPDFWTSFDDEYLIFDSFNNSVDSTLQASKTLALGTTMPTFTLEDAFVPDLDDDLFPLLLNEAKSWAHLELKQQSHAKAEQQSRRQKVSFQNDRERFKIEHTGPNYGRK